jgi:hypothetical protein
VEGNRLPRLLLDRCGITGLAGRLFERDALNAARKPPRYNLVVVDGGPGSVTVAAANPKKPPVDLRHRGVFALAWPGGYRMVGEPRVGEGVATREFLGEGPWPAPGTRARIDTFVFAPDPAARGFPHEEVSVSGPLGEYPAWLVPGRADTWVIAVHGKGASRREVIRALPAFAEAGLPVLAITYRNDRGAPQAPGGCYGYGDPEWTDDEAAVRGALDHGARRVGFNG